MVTMAERMKNVEEQLIRIDSRLEKSDLQREYTNEKLDTVIQKLDCFKSEMPSQYVTRREFNIYTAILGALAVVLLGATITLLYKVFSGGII